MQLTQFSDYGLRTLLYLASFPDRRCSVKEISTYYDVSHNHLVKVVHKLSQAGFILSFKGKGGGLKLAEGMLEKKLGDVVATLESNQNLVECFNKEENKCRITPACQVKHFLQKAQDSFYAELNTHTLKDCVQGIDVFMMDELKLD